MRVTRVTTSRYSEVPLEGSQNPSDDLGSRATIQLRSSQHNVSTQGSSYREEQTEIKKNIIGFDVLTCSCDVWFSECHQPGSQFGASHWPRQTYKCRPQIRTFFLFQTGTLKQQQTDLFDTVSKRSVERRYYIRDPQYFRHFVRKPHRRSALLNRLYWLRLKAVEHVVHRFLEDKGKHEHKVIINLGCGRFEP